MESLRARARPAGSLICRNALASFRSVGQAPRCMRTKSLLFAFLVSFTSLVRGAESPAIPDEQARYLAGLPMAGTSLFNLSQRQGWAAHAVHLDKAWQALDKRQLKPIDTWMTARLPDAASSKDPLLYMFSGPDFLYANAFFPNASTYVLCGIEPIGPLPDVGKIAPAELDGALAGLDKALYSVLEFSFFITKDMKSDLQSSKLSGTLPVLYTFLARSGCHLDTVGLVNVTPAGELAEGPGPVPGVRITFTKGGHVPQTLYYFSTDLADYAVAKTGFLKWMRSLGSVRSFAKAASYLMHGPNFSKVRQVLLDRSTLLIQDDSGIPVRFFEPAQWSVGVSGRYLGPLPIFLKDHPPQAQLKELYDRDPTVPLPFSFGYRWHPSESTFISARRLGPLVE